MCMKKQEKKEHKFVRGTMEGRSASIPKKTFHVKKKRKALDSYEDAVVGDIEREVDWEALEERARVRYWKERYGMKGASKGEGKVNVMGGDAGKEDNNIQTNEDEEDSGSIKAEDVCLREWWDDYTELKQFPHKEIEELVNEERSHLFRYMFESEQFREKYGARKISLEFGMHAACCYFLFPNFGTWQKLATHDDSTVIQKLKFFGVLCICGI